MQKVEIRSVFSLTNAHFELRSASFMLCVRDKTPAPSLVYLSYLKELAIYDLRGLNSFSRHKTNIAGFTFLSEEAARGVGGRLPCKKDDVDQNI